LALDMHHIWQVSAGGTDGPSNLIALCPTCHSLHHRGTIGVEAIYAYKAMLVALRNAFDFGAIDLLLFLERFSPEYFLVTSDGLLQFARLVSAGLVDFEAHKGGKFYHRLTLSEKGALLIEAWQAGDQTRLTAVLGPRDCNEPQILGA
jgi:hypothetical protein